MPKLGNHLVLQRCPHCGVDSPSLPAATAFNTQDSEATVLQTWKCYCCSRCGGVVTGWHHRNDGDLAAQQLFPETDTVDDAIPDRAAEFLSQAMNSLSAPAGAVMLAASSVDAMLKDKGYLEGSLYARIGAARDDHLITADMATWAHEVRLDANDQRHADEDAPIPTPEEAKQTIKFAKALAEFIFVLPSKISRGLARATGDS